MPVKNVIINFSFDMSYNIFSVIITFTLWWN